MGSEMCIRDRPTRLVGLIPGTLTAPFMEKYLRSYDPPVIARVERDRVLLDVRTIQERELKIVAGAVRELARMG